MEEGISEAFALLAELGNAIVASPFNKHPGCWEYQIDDQWWIAVNGHTEPMACSRSEIAIQPFHCYIEFNGWPAGVMNPVGGTIAAGDAANEDAFVQALRKRLREFPRVDTCTTA